MEKIDILYILYQFSILGYKISYIGYEISYIIIQIFKIIYMISHILYKIPDIKYKIFFAQVIVKWLAIEIEHRLCASTGR